MAVYRRTYNNYEGPLTPERWRFTVLPRYSLRAVFESKLVTIFFTLCFLPHLIAMFLIYALNNEALLFFIRTNIEPDALSFLSIDGVFFYTLFAAQTFFSFFLVTFIGPGLVSPDVANNALPLFLSRPFSRGEYVLGKIAVLLTLASLITWIPGLLLVVVQTDLAGMDWLWDNRRIPIGILLGSLTWILTISLIALALSAWIKSRPLATAALFGVFFIAGAFGQALNNILRLNPRWGDLLNFPGTMRMVWRWLLLNETVYGRLVRRGRVFIEGIPNWTGLLVLAGVCVLCLILLARKVRAVEVVR